MVVLVIQLEWIFLQRLMNGTGYTFAGVDNLIRGTFFTHFFFEESKYLLPIVGTLSTISVKKCGIGLQEPVTPDNKKYLSLICVGSKLTGSVMG